MVEIRHSKNKAFLNYWKSLPTKGLLPTKSSFKPEDVPSLLPGMHIYELVSEDFIKFRLVGSAVERRAGVNRTGTNYLDLVESHRKAKASKALWSQAEQPCGMVTLLEQELSSGRTAYIEALGLPIAPEEGQAPILLFQSNEIVREGTSNTFTEDVRITLYGERLKTIRLVERRFIDLGAGVSEFQD